MLPWTMPSPPGPPSGGEEHTPARRAEPDDDNNTPDGPRDQLPEQQQPMAVDLSTTTMWANQRQPMQDSGVGPVISIVLFVPPPRTPPRIKQATPAGPPAPIYSGLHRTQARLPIWPQRPRRPARTPFRHRTSVAEKPAHPRTHPTCSPSAVRPTRAPRLTDHGPVSTPTAAPRALPLPGRQLPHVRPACPASLGRLSGPPSDIDHGPSLGQPSPRPPLASHGRGIEERGR